jgi:acyl transferase domain-containing protein
MLLLSAVLRCTLARSPILDSPLLGKKMMHLDSCQSAKNIVTNLSACSVCGADGRCYAFDHRAQGYGRGEGVATLIVKRLEDAIRDRDPIRAIIRETGANQDGKTETITSPDAEAQMRLIRQCYARAGLDPLDTDVVEAHGTGTMIGDKIEATAIGTTLGAGRPVDKPLYIASVKTNIGHTEAASGLASIIKMAMSLEHNEIAPSLNYEKANPNIDLERLHLKV